MKLDEIKSYFIWYILIYLKKKNRFFQLFFMILIALNIIKYLLSLENISTLHIIVLLKRYTVKNFLFIEFRTIEIIDFAKN